MSITGFIEHVRKQPEAHRERVVIMSALLITGVLFLLWMVDFRLSLGSDGSSDAPSPVSIVGGNVKALFNEAVSKFKAQ